MVIGGVPRSTFYVVGSSLLVRSSFAGLEIAHRVDYCFCGSYGRGGAGAYDHSGGGRQRILVGGRLTLLVRNDHTRMDTGRWGAMSVAPYVKGSVA